jgi:hypothetical protein
MQNVIKLGVVTLSVVAPKRFARIEGFGCLLLINLGFSFYPKSHKVVKTIPNEEKLWWKRKVFIIKTVKF